MDARWTGCDVCRRVRRGNIVYPISNSNVEYTAYRTGKIDDTRVAVDVPTTGPGGLTWWVGCPGQERIDRDELRAGLTRMLRRERRKKRRQQKEGPNLFCSTAINHTPLVQFRTSGAGSVSDMHWRQLSQGAAVQGGASAMGILPDGPLLMNLC